MDHMNHLNNTFTRFLGLVAPVSSWKQLLNSMSVSKLKKRLQNKADVRFTRVCLNLRGALGALGFDMFRSVFSYAWNGLCDTYLIRYLSHCLNRI